MTLIDDYIDYQERYEKEYGKNTVVFMQVGHFYECYEVESPKKVGKSKELSDILNIVLTRKSKKNNLEVVNKKNPYLIGVQIYSFEKYLKVLLKQNYTVVMIDEVTPAPNPKRKVTNIYSPGTYLETNNLNNYILSIYVEEIKNLLFFGLSVIDLSIGKSIIYEVNDKPSDKSYAIDEVQRYINSFKPSEIIIHSKLPKSFFVKEFDIYYCPVHYNILLNSTYDKLSYQQTFFEKVFENDSSLNIFEYLNIEHKPYCRLSYLYLLEYCYKHDDSILKKINYPTYWEKQKHLILNSNTVEQLCVSELLKILNKCQTKGGKRLFEFNLLNPIIDVDELNYRYNLIDVFRKTDVIKINDVVDLERYHRRMSLSKLHPCELFTLYNSYLSIHKLMNKIKDSNLSILYNNNLDDNLINIIKELENDINFDEILKYKLTDITRNFFNQDKYEDLDNTMKRISKHLAVIDGECTRLNDIIKVNENDSFIKITKNDKEGYHLTTTNRRALKLKNVDDCQFIKNTSVTKIFTSKIKDSSLNILSLENYIKSEVKDKYTEYLNTFYEKHKIILFQISEFISKFDVYQTSALISKKYNYNKPIIEKRDYGFIDVKKLRHPIIEHINDNMYVPNDIKMDNDLRGVLLFGLNSSGKSAFIKSLGILIIMAQAGLYVPCGSLIFSPYKILLTRILGNDNIMKSQSSFTIEMIELRSILNRADEYSLILGDEICRGTEINSGIALVAASIIQLQKCNSTFIYTTHLHDLSSMKDIEFKNVKSYHLEVNINKNDITYSRILKEGSGSSIYGLEVARALNLNKEFIMTAEKIRRKRLKEHNTILPVKTSRYNSNVYIDKCCKCGTTQNLETHHIRHQKEADSDGFIEHFHKDSKHNLMVLCDKCHDSVH